MERVEFAGLAGVRVHRQFRSSGGAVVRIGQVGDQWFAWHSRRGKAWVFVYERSMADLADKWLARGGPWTELREPANSP
jgi:hypothetical protein